MGYNYFLDMDGTRKVTFQLTGQESIPDEYTPRKFIFLVQIHICVRPEWVLCVRIALLVFPGLPPESISISFQQFMHNRRILKNGNKRLFTGAGASK